MHTFIKRQKTRLFAALGNEKAIYSLVILLCITAAFAPHILRFSLYGTLILPQEQGYRDIIIADNIADSWKEHINSMPLLRSQPIPFDNCGPADPGCVGEYSHLISRTSLRYVQNGPEHYVLAAAMLLMGKPYATIFLGLFSAIISIALLCFVLREYNLSPRISALLFFILFLSPASLYNATIFSRFSLITPLMLIAALFMFRKGRERFLSLIVLAIMPLFGFFIAIASILCTAALIAFSQNEKRLFLRQIMVVQIIVSIAFFGWLFFSEKLFFAENIIEGDIFYENLSMFGAEAGFSLFAVILAIIGIIYSWRNKKQHYGAYIMLAILAFMAILFEPLIKIPLTVLVSYFAALGFSSVIEFGWSLKIVRKLTITAVILGVIVACVSYTISLAQSEPKPETISALTWLEANSEKDDIFLSDYRNGYFIEYYAGRIPVLDSGIGYMPDAESRYEDAHDLLSTRNYTLACKLIDNYSVDYVFIDKKTEQLMYSKKNVRGLSFLLESVKTFKKEYCHSGIDIWKVEIPETLG